MDLQLSGKRALVTGSTSGIGFAIARTLAAAGARVAVTATTARIHDRAAELGGIGHVADLGCLLPRLTAQRAACLT